MVFNVGCGLINGFEINEDWKLIYNNLLLYFTGNESDYDLNKGIWLFGDYGAGKTVCMSVFRKFLASAFPFSGNGFGITSMEDITEYYKDNGNLSVFGRNYLKKEYDTGRGARIENHIKRNPYCINEMGKPLNEKHYGTDMQNVVNSLMMVRYELFQEYGILTHATSNFSPADLTCFDRAVMDRVVEMFNFVEIKGGSLRK